MSNLIHVDDGGELRGGISGGTMVVVCKHCGLSWTIETRQWYITEEGEPAEFTLMPPIADPGAVSLAKKQQPEWFKGKK